MPKVIDEVAAIFEFDFPSDKLDELSSPSYIDIPRGILKKPSTIHYCLKHPCETNVKVLHVCEPIANKPSPK